MPCADGEHEPNVEKVAIYIDQFGIPTHVALQLPDGRWTSKLGDWDDITHQLEALTGNPLPDKGWPYGTVAQFLRRPRVQA